MAMMTLLAALMLFYCSRSITLIAKIQNLGPEIPQTLGKVYLTLTLCILASVGRTNHYNWCINMEMIKSFADFM